MLTASGLTALRASSEPYLAAVGDLFASRFDDAELETLVELLGRLSGAEDENCSAPDEPDDPPSAGLGAALAPSYDAPVPDLA